MRSMEVLYEALRHAIYYARIQRTWHLPPEQEWRVFPDRERGRGGTVAKMSKWADVLWGSHGLVNMEFEQAVATDGERR